MIISVSDLQGLIAFAILNNKQGVINAMNATNNTVAASISDDELYDKVWALFVQKGITALQNVLSRVTIFKNTVTQQQKDVLTSKFKNKDSTAKFSDWFNGALTTMGDLLGGSTVSSGTPGSQTTESPISGTAMLLIALAGIIGIGIFRKFKIVVIAIIAILVLVALYAILGKKTVTTGGTTTSTQHGGIGQSIATFFGVIF